MGDPVPPRSPCRSCCARPRSSSPTGRSRPSRSRARRDRHVRRGRQGGGPQTIRVKTRAPSGRDLGRTRTSLCVHGREQRGAVDHDRRRAAAAAALVEEVGPTTEALTPDQDRPEEHLSRHDRRLRAEHRAHDRRHDPVASDRYVRIAAQTAALGVTIAPLGNVYTQANTTPNIVYELILGGILTSVFVPVFVDHQRRNGREAAFDLGRRVLTLALVLLSAVAIVGIVFAPQIMRLYLSPPSAADREAADRARACSCCAGSCRRSSSTASGRSPAGCSTPSAGSPPPMFAPILNNLVAIAAFAGLRHRAGRRRRRRSATSPAREDRCSAPAPRSASSR